MQLDALVQRAEAGDPVSICKLLVSINQCHDQVRRQGFSKLALNALTKNESDIDGLLVASVAADEEHMAQRGGYCAGVDLETLPAASSLFAETYRLNVAQKTIIALTRPDGSLARLHRRASYSQAPLHVHPQFLADNALHYLAEGYRAAEPLALEGLVMVHTPGVVARPGGTLPWLPNPHLFLKYLGLMHRLQGPAALEGEVGLMYQAARDAMPVESLARIEREVEADFQRWVSVSRAKGLDHAYRPPLDFEPRSGCEK